MDRYTIHLVLDSTTQPEILSPILSVPVEHVSTFSTKPLKWLRYVMSAILGAEGELAFLVDRKVVDYDQSTTTGREFLYRPTSALKFIDVHALDHLTSSQSSQMTTESRIGFRQSLVERDLMCVMTDYHAEDSIAAHLIPRSKGSQYIQALSLWRAGEDEPYIDDIMDIRNGLLLTATLDRLNTNHGMAVLRSPNFAMDPNDVLPAPSDIHVAVRFTPHYFRLHIPRFSEFSGRDLRTPHIKDRWPEDWPPSFLWDFIYGVICAEKYGIKSTLKTLDESSSHAYYLGGIKAYTDRMKADLERRKQEQVKKNEARRNEDGPDMYDIVLNNWLQSRFGPLGISEAEYDAEVEELEQSQQEEEREISVSKVLEWKDGVDG